MTTLFEGHHAPESAIKKAEDDLGVSEPAPVTELGTQYIIIAAYKSHPKYSQWYYRLEDLLKKAEKEHIIVYRSGVR